MSDLIERLRQCADKDGDPRYAAMLREAADELEAAGRERDEAILARERDEARADDAPDDPTGYVARVRKGRTAVLEAYDRQFAKMKDRWERATRERDEARAEVERLRRKVEFAAKMGMIAPAAPAPLAADEDLAKALDLLSFHEGAAEVIYDRDGDRSACPVVAINEEDFETILRCIRSAAAGPRPAVRGRGIGPCG